MIKIKIKKSSMITERLTDTLYGAISHYIYNLLSDGKTYESKIVLASIPNKDRWFPAVNIKIKTDDFGDPNMVFKDYQDKTGDTKILTNDYSFNQFFRNLYIQILPQEVNPRAGGSMDRYGEMTIYLKNWSPKTVSTAEAEVRGGGKWGNERKIKDFRDITLEEVKEIWGEAEQKNIEKIIDETKTDKFAKSVERTLSHEIGHYINFFRAGSLSGKLKGYTASGGNKQFDSTTKYYARSTEEWQARYTQATHLLQKTLKMKFPDLEKDLKYINDIDLNDNYSSVARRFTEKYINIIESSGIPLTVFKILQALYFKDFTNFSILIKELSDFYDYEAKLNPKTINKVNARMYSLYQDLRKKVNEPFFKLFEIIDYTL
jgi:hypothetical protein